MTGKQVTSASVVIPVYCHTEAHEGYLSEALGSVAQQAFRGFEVVIVDDASPRDIAPIIQAVGGLPELRVLRNAANLGHAESRNIGIRAARGEFIAFLDHDDLWLPGKLERQARALTQQPDAGMVFCDVDILGSCPPGLYVDQRTIPDRPSLRWMLTHNNAAITVSAVVARKDAMLEIGLFDTRYSSCDDFDAWIKIAMRRPVIHIPEVMAKYRLHEHNVNYSVDRLNDNRLLTRLMLSYWRNAPLVDRLAMLPVLARKLVGRALYKLSNMRGKGPTGREADPDPPSTLKER